ncbi:biotin transporter BioY [Leuconostocaceae bacterium ESL0958]|nr:biotin transporter BioY [Leuconostocaceae bacterium ESL0958]
MQAQTSIQKLTQMAFFLALVIVLGLFPALPLGVLPVPIVLQNLAVLLMALLLPTRQAVTVMLGFLLLLALGLPVLSGGRGGLLLVVGPTAGYLWSWLLLAPVYRGFSHWLGRLWPRFQQSYSGRGLLLLLVNTCLVYPLGAAWLSWHQHLAYWPTLWANVVFLPGDFVKVALAVVVALALERALRLARN